MVATGAFREDLYYRLNLIALHLPPLRQRRGDVTRLAEHFLSQLRTRFDRPELDLTRRARLWVEQQPWPGNVRELKSTLERAALLSDHAQLDLDDLTANATSSVTGAAVEPIPAVGAMTLDQMERAMIVKALEHHAGNITHVANALGLTRAALYRRLKKFGLDA
jgi:DNA-binding NtrC family response regulator